MMRTTSGMHQGVRFGEAYKVSMPIWKPYLRGHDGIDFEKANLAPLKQDGERWSMLEKLLKKPAGLVNAYDPLTQQKSTYIITNGPKQDTFDRVQSLKTQMESITGNKHTPDIPSAVALALPLHGLIAGNEPVIELEENLGKQHATLRQHGLAAAEDLMDTPELVGR